MRLLSLLLLTGCLFLASTAFAQDDTTSPDDQAAPDTSQQDQAPPADTPSGPQLQPADFFPTVCDPSQAGFRYNEVRGSGFDAFAGQRLVGSLVANATGAPQAYWSSVFVSGQGTLTLEVNLCADPMLRRGALPTGDYTVAVGPGTGGTIAATAFSISPPPDESDVPAEAPVLAATPAPTSTPFSYVIPTIQAQPSPTPLPIPGLSGTTQAATTPTAAAGPSNTGRGSLQQPYPPGAPGNLVDGWQLLITGVSPDAFTGIQNTYPSAITPAADQRDYEVRVQATYLGQGTGVFGSVRLALLSTKTGQVYDQFANNCGTVPDMVPPDVVTQGQGVRGNVCFVVRAADVNSLVAYDNQPDQADRVYFALQ